jgi:DNA-binding SARP family transcriptional activator
VTTLEIQLFGGLAVFDAEGNELRLGARKVRALIAILAVEGGRWHSRERLAALLWERHGVTQARNSLNQALHEIRRLETAAGTRLVERESDRLRLVQGGVECDLHRFDSLLTSDPLAAAALYQGELLEDFELAEEAFSDWISPKRSHYRALVVEALLSAAATAAESGDHEAGTHAARRLVALEPLDERARRQLMRLLADSGNRAEARSQYRICEEILRKELGVEPEAETRALLAEINRQEPVASATVSAVFAPSFLCAASSAQRDRPVLAVLPFDSLSDDADSAWLGDGLAEDVIFELSTFRWFRVLARTATFRLRDAGLDHAPRTKAAWRRLPGVWHCAPRRPTTAGESRAGGLRQRRSSTARCGARSAAPPRR